MEYTRTPYELSNTIKTFAVLNEIQKKSKGKIPFTTDQVAELWKFVDDVPFADMVLIAMYTGFRPQELAVLETKNTFLDEKGTCIIYIRM